MKREKKFMIIDGHALLYRAWHALPPLTTKEGEMVNAVYGFVTILLKTIKEFKPEYIAVTFDRAAPTFRHKAFEAYKAQRKRQPDEFYRQISRVYEFLSALHIQVYEMDGYEADDIIATLCRQTCELPSPPDIVIVTGDMDTLQLVDDHVSVTTPQKGMSDDILYNKKMVKDRFGLAPEQLVYYKALRGDPSDNIPGVPGIGEKTAAELIQKYKDLDGLYAHVLKPSFPFRERVRELLIAHKDDAFKSFELVQLRHDVPLSFSLSACAYQTPDYNALVELFQKLEFKSLLPRIMTLPKEVSRDHTNSTNETSIKKTYHCVFGKDEEENFLTTFKQKKIIAIDTETTSMDAIEASLVGMSFSWKEGEGWYLPWKEVSQQTKKDIRDILEDTSVRKVGHNAKYDMEVLMNEEIRLGGLFFDTMIAAYILNPGVRGYSLDALSFSEFGYQKIPIESLIGSGKEQCSMESVPLEQISQYACEDADFTWRLYELFLKRLDDDGIRELFKKIEMPVIEVICEMERNGVSIDAEYFKELLIEVVRERTRLEKKIFKLAGEEFNINSPLQLKKILFEKLELSPKGVRRKKTGLSTAASELEKMRSLHPIIDFLLEYREFVKLETTYVSVLPTLINQKTHRVHTTYNQAVVATGRFSSTNPNLQNIPVRTEWGQRIRRGFVAQKGYLLLSADYSQLELRIVAALSGDQTMIGAFQAGEDIHATTAAAIHKVALDKVTKEMRSAAKAVNFGILYGMGSNSLSQSIGVSYHEAQNFIDSYFLLYPKVREYLDLQVALARSRGYVETLFGRRRYLPEIQSGVQQVRAAAERMAFNTPVQGTEADIVKLAMIEVYRTLCETYRIDSCPFDEKPVRMILQVHDELVFEVKKDIVSGIAPEIKMRMEGVVQLATPLVVDLSVGKNWDELMELHI